VSSVDVEVLPSRVNTVLALSRRVVLKMPGKRFRRGLRVFDPREMLRHEARCLVVLEEYDIAPRLIYFDGSILLSSFCGESLEVSKPPLNWRVQIDRMSSALAEEGIQHLDIKASNLVTDGEKLRLVDFGWSVINGRGFIRPGIRSELVGKHTNTDQLRAWTRTSLTNIISNVV